MLNKPYMKIDRPLKFLGMFWLDGEDKVFTDLFIFHIHLCLLIREKYKFRWGF